MPAGRPPLDRLLDRDAVDALLERVAATLPAGVLEIEDGHGIEVPDGSDGTHRRPLFAGEDVVGTLVGRAGIPAETVEHVAAGLELAIREAVARRGLALEALEAYRELSLLYRVAETIGSTLDSSSIGPSILFEAQRVLRSDAAVVLPLAEGAASGEVVAADIGSRERIDALIEHGRGLVAHVERSGNPELEASASTEFGSMLAAPLRTRGRVLGVVLLGRDRSRPPFSAGDQKLVLALAQNAAIAYERANLHRRDGDRLRMEHELALGRRIQVGLLPRQLLQPPGWELAAAYEPAREVGGDFYDVFRTRGRRASLGIVIADVTGKGIPAALMMADARAILRAAADHSKGPAEALERVNAVLVGERRTALFVTAFHGVLDLRTGELRYASAGHEAPLVVPANGSRIRALESEGPLLGAFPRLNVRDSTTRLDPGDLLVAYTDGVTDARSERREWFGEPRLRRVVRRSRGRPADGTVRAILESVHAFQGLLSPADDVTLLAVRRLPSRRAEASGRPSAQAAGG